MPPDVQGALSGAEPMAVGGAGRGDAADLSDQLINQYRPAATDLRSIQ
jgi:hypothetical protein